MIKVVGLGIGGSSAVVYDALERSEYSCSFVGWFDDDLSKKGTTHLDHPIVDSIDNIKLYKDFFDVAVICIGSIKNTKARNKIFNLIEKEDIVLHNLIAPTATVSKYATLGKGCTILDGVIVNALATISDNVFLNTGCIIEHDCTIGTSSFISPGAVLCGNTKVEDNVFIGANAVILGNITIGANSIIGAGSVIISDVKPGSTVVGNPGKVIKV